MLDRGVEQVKLATDDENLQFEALLKFLEFLASNASKKAVPSYLGSKRNKIITEITNNSDPYRRLKQKSNEVAEQIEPIARKLVEAGENEREKLNRSLKIAAAANSMEYGVSKFEFDPEGLQSKFENLLDEELKIDDSREISSKILSSSKVLYLTDNCGEIILDHILMGEIAKTGAEVFIGAKSSPTQDDVTVEMAEKLGTEKFGKIIPSGEKVGLFLDDAPDEMKNIVESAGLVISKGMGNFETISEYEEKLKGKLVYLLRAKCTPVAQSLGVERGELVVTSPPT